MCSTEQRIREITGNVYEDTNQNGARDKGEDGIQGWQVYLDLDNSGTRNTDAAVLEPIATTDGDGKYTFSRLIPAAYRVGEIVPTGWTSTSPTSLDVNVATNVTYSDRKFFNFQGGNIAGTVWNDL